MSSSFDINTAFDALDDLSAMSSTWIPGAVRSLPLSPVMNPFVTPPRAPADVLPGRAVTPDQPLPLRYPPSPRQSSPLPYYQPPLPPLRPPSQVYLGSPTRERVVRRQPPPHPPPVLWTTPLSQPPPRPTLPQNSTSALCGCLSVSTSGSHVDGNQGSTNRVYGVWLKSSTPQKP